MQTCTFELNDMPMSALKLGALSFLAFSGLPAFACGDQGCEDDRCAGIKAQGVCRTGGDMKAVRRVIAGIVVLLMTYGFVRLWLGSAVSERFWTWWNARLSGGTDPGMASDVELAIVVAAAFGLSAGAWWVFSSTWARRRARHST